MAESFIPLTTSNLGGSISSITSAVDTNFSTIKTLLNDILSRSGASPNTMSSALDLNSNRILNLPPAGSLTDPVRLGDLTSGVGATGPQGIQGPAGPAGTLSAASSINLSGNITYTNSLSGPANGGGIWTNTNTAITATGKSTDTILAELTNLQIDDRVDASTPVNGLVDYQFYAVTNSPAKGNRTGFQTNLVYNGSSDTNKDYAGAQMLVSAQTSNGGTVGTGNGKGSLFSLGLYSYLKSGALYWNSNTGLEIDMGIQTGASADLQAGMQIVKTVDDVIAANKVSICYNANNGYLQGAGAGWDILYCDGSYAGQPALKTTGTLLGCYLHAGTGTKPTIAYGVDFNNYSSITGALIRGPGNNGSIDGNFFITHTGSNLFNSGVYSGTVINTGTGYVPGDTYVPTLTGATVNSILTGGIGAFNTSYGAASFYVMSTQVVSATVAAAGTGGNNGVATVTGTTGTGTKFTASVNISGGGITSVISILTGGVYQVNPTDITQEPVIGANLSGAKLNLGMGVLFVNVQNPGSYSKLTANPLTATQSSTSGGGSGATLSVTFAPAASYLLPPSNSINGVGGAQASFNSGVGYLALNSITSGVENTAFGWNALGSCTTGGFNTAIGINSFGAAMTTGSNNVGVGGDSGRNNTTGSDNVFVGTAAGQGGNSGYVPTANVMIGSGAGGHSGTTPSTNVFIGYHAGFSHTSSSQNVFVGSEAGFNFSAVGNTNNVFVGMQAGKLVTTGISNICLGAQVGSTTLTTGTRNILIGTASNTDTAASGTNDTIIIGCSTLTTPWLTGSLTAAAPTAIFAGPVTVSNATATPAGGTAGQGLLFGTTTNFGIFYGSSTPTLSAAKGSLYLRSDGAQNARLYINTDGSTTWTAFSTAS